MAKSKYYPHNFGCYYIALSKYLWKYVCKYLGSLVYMKRLCIKMHVNMYIGSQSCLLNIVHTYRVDLIFCQNFAENPSLLVRLNTITNQQEEEVSDS